MSWKIRDICRLCEAIDVEAVLELKPTPPANEFLLPLVQEALTGDMVPPPEQELIPLYLARCGDCGHVQLPVVVDPERLFRDYVYVSGTSPAFVRHFEQYAKDETIAARLHENDLVVDVGSNDGTLLKAFKALGHRVLGIDPAKEIAARASADGVETWPQFFTREIAAQIRWEHGEAAMVVANNVFAHADDLRGIALAVRDLLAPARGVFVFEVQYLVDLVEKTLFDMVYHEHLSYHSLGPLVRFFDSVGMTLFDAEHVDTHGGSIRCRAVPRRGAKQTDRLRALLDHEANALALSVDPFGKLSNRITVAGHRLRTFLDAERMNGRMVVGYGAPAKLTTLCHQFGITREDIDSVVDDSPWKQGLLTPGTRIPVVKEVSPLAFSVVIFAWNFAEPISKKLRAAGFTGKIVTPLPEFKEI